MTAPAELDLPDVDETTEQDRPWVAIVWNDPVNLMSYVTHVLMELFGYPRSHAERLMLDVHHKGRAVVSSGTLPGALLATLPPAGDDTAPLPSPIAAVRRPSSAGRAEASSDRAFCLAWSQGSSAATLAS